MSNLFLPILIFVIQLSCIHSVSITEFDPTFYSTLFTVNNNYKTIKYGYSPQVLSSNGNGEIEFSVPAADEIQCLIEFFRTPFAIRYSFELSSLKCKIKINENRTDSSLDSKVASKIQELISIDLSSCKNGLYCYTVDKSESNTKTGIPVCELISKTGNKCQNQVNYSYSEWSNWTPCSTSCQDGLSFRYRTCLKKYKDSSDQQKTEVIQTSDDLCKTSPQDTLTQINECSTKLCNLYSAWTEWSGCTNLCTGTRNRRRNCLIDPSNSFCRSELLTENEFCTILSNCSATNLKLDTNTGSSDYKGLKNFGRLSFYNPLSGETYNIFSYTDNADDVAKIGTVVCRDFYFNGLAGVESQTVDTKQYGENYDKILQQSVRGLKCTGKEKTVKECTADVKVDTNVKLYELNVYCQVNGYWAEWGNWGTCSVTCGTGLYQRSRVCSDPEPSISKFKDGATCPGNTTSREPCVMPRCKNVLPSR